MPRLLIALLIAIGLPLAAIAHNGLTHNEVEASEPFARATTPSAKVGIAYMTLISLDDDAVFIGANTSAANEVQLHTHSSVDGIVRMRRVEAGIPLPLGEAVTLAPGGMHIMLIGLTAPLKKGETVALELLFENADPVTVEVPVLGIAARGAHGHAHGSHGAHDASAKEHSSKHDDHTEHGAAQAAKKKPDAHDGHTADHSTQ